jgi:hypothetical protein
MYTTILTQRSDVKVLVRMNLCVLATLFVEVLEKAGKSGQLTDCLVVQPYMQNVDSIYMKK